MLNILIVDDDIAVCTSLSLLLKRKGYAPKSIQRPEQVLNALEKNDYPLVLLDMNFAIETSGKKGLELLKKIRAGFPEVAVILMTGWATIQLAVEGMKLGAKDFIAKPWDNKQLVQSIKTILDLQRPEGNNEKDLTHFEHIIGQDPAFKKVLEMAQRVSKTNAPVLIVGESGTGKELIAEAIHYESLRANEPFVKVNLGGISTSLFESEMFGHKKGAFTDASTDRIGRFEMADKGSIFLDEIGDLPLESQVKLLRVLQESTFEVLGSSQTKRIDTRVISATNKDLEEMVKNGNFREDLYYRINLIKLEIPPLRERPNDIPLLINRFIANLKTIYQRPEIRVSDRGIEWLKKQVFPGNIRQLKNLVERTVLVSPSDFLDIDDFKQHHRGKDSLQKASLPEVGSISLEEMEISMIQQALQHHQGNVTHAAQSLGITRSALYRRLAKHPNKIKYN